VFGMQGIGGSAGMGFGIGVGSYGLGGLRGAAALNPSPMKAPQVSKTRKLTQVQSWTPSPASRSSASGAADYRVHSYLPHCPWRAGCLNLPPASMGKSQAIVLAIVFSVLGFVEGGQVDQVGASEEFPRFL
jgi:hypothetical protein